MIFKFPRHEAAQARLVREAALLAIIHPAVTLATPNMSLHEGPPLFSRHDKLRGGYLEPALRSDILRAGVLDTVQKPYDFREMKEKIRSIIGEPEAEEDTQPQLF